MEEVIQVYPQLQILWHKNFLYCASILALHAQAKMRGTREATVKFCSPCLFWASPQSLLLLCHFPALVYNTVLHASALHTGSFTALVQQHPWLLVSHTVQGVGNQCQLVAIKEANVLASRLWEPCAFSSGLCCCTAQHRMRPQGLVYTASYLYSGNPECSAGCQSCAHHGSSVQPQHMAQGYRHIYWIPMVFPVLVKEEELGNWAYICSEHMHAHPLWHAKEYVQ